MKRIHHIGSIVFAVLLTVTAAVGQRKVTLVDNAALRYWAAFAQLQDAGITDQDAKELDEVLDKMTPFDLSRYNELMKKNTPALETMARGTSLPNCEWGVDYGLGADAPVDYARKALVLGRLNMLYVMQLYHSGNPDGAIRALAAGLRFSHDVANGGSLFATLIAKDLLVTHLMAVSAAVRMGQLSPSQRAQLRDAVAALGYGLDWPAAAKRDVEALGSPYPHESAAISRIASSYAAFLKDKSNLPGLTDAISHAPAEVAQLIPNPKRVEEQKQELSEKLLQTRALMQ